MRISKIFTNLELVLIIVIVILIYIITFGKVNFSDKVEDKEERKEKRPLSSLKHRHKRLKDIIAKQGEVSKKLNKRFKFIYNSVKIVMVLLFLAVIVTLYFVFNVTNLGQLSTLIGALTMLMVMASFLAFGTLNGVSDFNNSIKMKLESSILSKCIAIEERLPIYKQEEKMLAEAISIQEKEILIHNKKVIDNNTFSIEKKDDIA